jgi:AraC-like DNA-binding protein
MIIQVPECFENHTDILRLPNLTFMYYFNKNKSDKVSVNINQHMLIHIFNGSKIIHNNEKSYKIAKQQSAFISKGQYLMSEILSLDSGCFDGMLVFFDDEFLLSVFGKYPSLINKIPVKKFSFDALCLVEKSSAMHETMLSAQTYLRRASDEPLLIQLKFEEIFLQLLHNNQSCEILIFFQKLYEKSVFKFKDLFEQNYFSSVEEMIVKSQLSAPQFRRLFQKLYATTPKEWLVKKSLNKAKKLLENNDLNVSSVCYECGFNSISWFIKSFKKEFGITPKKYQQNY